MCATNINPTNIKMWRTHLRGFFRPIMFWMGGLLSSWPFFWDCFFRDSIKTLWKYVYSCFRRFRHGHVMHSHWQANINCTRTLKNTQWYTWKLLKIQRLNVQTESIICLTTQCCIVINQAQHSSRRTAHHSRTFCQKFALSFLGKRKITRNPI